MIKKKLKKNELLQPIKEGAIVEGEIVKVGKSAVFLNLGGKGTGVIYGREFYEAKEDLKELKLGDKLFAKVVDVDNEDGYVELSLSRARQELVWRELQEKKEKGETIRVKIVGANKGGLLARVSGIVAFLPVSQLSLAHYPKVKGGETAKILRALQKFVGQELEVKIFDVSPRHQNLILSEKASQVQKRRDVLESCKVGDVVKGRVTAVTDFGAFLAFTPPPRERGGVVTGEENAGSPAVIEGLIHISELSNQSTESPASMVEVGQELKAKIIDISGDKVALSLKALEGDAKTPGE